MIGDTYATLAEFKAYMKVATTNQFGGQLTDALNSASREVERITGRQFNTSGVATPRIYRPEGRWICRVDDFVSAAGLVVQTDVDNDGIFETTWISSEYELEPVNQIVEGEPGWPYNKLRAVAGHWFPFWRYSSGDTANNRYGLGFMRKNTVQITANWGWPSVPSPVKQATLILAAQTFELKGAPLGVASMSQFGAVHVKDNGMIQTKLKKYTRYPAMVG